MNNMHWADLLFNLSMSLFGGLVKSLVSPSKKKKLSTYIASAIIGGFAGLLTYMLCANFEMSPMMTGFATGVAGFMGDSILELFSKILPKILEGKLHIEIENDEDEKTKSKSKGKKKK